MRDHQTVVEVEEPVVCRQGLGVGDIQGRTGDPTVLQRRDEGFGVDYRPTRHVHQIGRLLHGIELCRGDQSPRGLVEPGAQDHVIRLAQEIFEIEALGINRFFVRRCVDHLHPEPDGAPGNGPANPSDAHHPESGPVQIATGEMKRLPSSPVARPDLPLAFGEPAHDRGEQGESRIGHRLGEDVRGVTDDDPTSMTSSNVDVVDAHRHLGDDLEPRRGFEEILIDPVGEHAEQSLHSLHLLEKETAGNRPSPLPDSRRVPGQSLEMIVGELLRDIDATHQPRLNASVPATDNISTMRLRPSLIVLSLFAAACGAGSAGPSAETAPRAEPAANEDVEDSLVAVTEPTRPVRAVWAGFDETNEETLGLTAVARGALDVYGAPGDTDPQWTLEPTTILGTTTVLGVVTGPNDGWVEVMLPVRPNGSTGWVETDHLSFYIADGEIVVDLSARRLTYLVDGVEVLGTDVGVGSDYNATPTGTYFVTDSVTITDPTSPWGPHALGLSARSDSITEFNGGDGIIGIHGTNNPGSIGDNISLGCIRLPNDVIAALHEMVPIGTRVTINA